MKNLELRDLEIIEGGVSVKGFCAGFTSVAAIALIGAKLNFWNPVGVSGGIAIGVISLGCLYANY